MRQAGANGLPNTKSVLFGKYGNSGAASKGPRVDFATALSSPVDIGSILNDRYESRVDIKYLS